MLAFSLRRARLCAVLLLSVTAGCGPTDTGAAPAAKQEESSPAAKQDAPAPQAATSFLVRFKAPHPLARAQELEGAGRCEEARQLAQETMTARAELTGLCFDRFTAGGAEVVLSACAPVAPGDAEAFQRAWVQKFATMEGVEYAEPNVVVTAVSCP